MNKERATWRIWPILIVAMALQTTWLAHKQLLGIHVDLPLLTVVSVALLLGWETGALYGLAAGVLTGYCADWNVGSLAFSRAVVGGVLGFAELHFSRENPLAPSLCAAGAVLLANVVLLIMAPLDHPVMWWVQQTPISMAIHMVLIWPVYAVVDHLVLLPARSMFAGTR